MSASKRLLQICPHDSAPFGDLIQVIGIAGAAVDMAVTNVFLGPAAGTPIPGCDYLNIEDLSKTRQVSAALAPLVQQEWSLVLCHRYRSYWGAVRAGINQQRCIVLAHEYGLLKKWQRRLGRWVYGRQVHFAGVSKPVAEELAGVTGHSVVLPNVVDVQALRQGRLSRSRALAELGLADASPTVGMGTGEMDESLRQQAGADVYFTGNVPQARNFMAAFDVLLYPAQADSFGMVVLEAMDAGVPVVTQARHGPAYVLDEVGCYAADDTAGEYARALQRALQLDRTELTSRGQQRVEQLFSVSAMARMLDHLLIEGVGVVPGW